MPDQSVVYYYVSSQGNREEPLTLEQLKAVTLTSETAVWHRGITEWQPAKSLKELKSVFFDKTINAAQPPDIPTVDSSVLPRSSAPVLSRFENFVAAKPFERLYAAISIYGFGISGIYAGAAMRFFVLFASNTCSIRCIRDS